MTDDPAVPMSYEPSGSAGDDQSGPDGNQGTESEAFPSGDVQSGAGGQAEADPEAVPSDDGQDSARAESAVEPEAVASTDTQDVPGSEGDPEPEAEPSTGAQDMPRSEPEPEPETTSPTDAQHPLISESDSGEATLLADTQDISSSEVDPESETPTLTGVQDTPSGESVPEPASAPSSQVSVDQTDRSDAHPAAVPGSGTQTAVKAKAKPASAAQRAAGSVPEGESAVMPLMEHLIELRGRLIWAVLALLITTGISFIFAKQVLILLIAPMGDAMPQALKPTESLGNYMKVALICGVTLAMPMIVYQIGAFLAPGLTKQERRWLFLLVPGATLSFVMGAAFAYFVMLPTAIPFLQGFMSDIIEQGWAIGEYLSFVTSLLFWIGLAFELPLFVFFLAKLGVVNVEMLTKNRKYAYLGISVVAAVITPTVDPLNMMLVMAPLVVLYELGVILARIA